MRLFRPALCIYLGLVLSIAYTTAFGPLGAREYLQAESRVRDLEENLAALERINKNLSEELRSLSTDPETITLLARDLGYYRRGDRRVAVPGLPLRGEGRTVGQLVTNGAEESGRESTLRLGLFVLPLAAYTMLRLAGRLRTHGSAARKT